MSIFENKELVAQKIYLQMPMYGKAGENLLLIGEPDALIANVKADKQVVESVEQANDLVVCTGHGYINGTSVVFHRASDTAVLPSPLVEMQRYHIRRDTAEPANKFSLHPTLKDALENTAKIDITSAGSGVYYVELIISEPSDFGEGAISNAIQYDVELSREAVKQLDMSYRTTRRIIPLDYILKKYFGIAREFGETDEDYFDRAKDNLFKYPQVSYPSVKNSISRYADEVNVIAGAKALFYCDMSCLDSYRTYNNAGNRTTPAILGNIYGLPFQFIIVINGIDAANIQKVLNFLKTTIAAGVTYTVIITNIRG